jgi:hypothetical protein
MACIGARVEHSLEDIFASCNERLRDTRGVALALAFVDLARARVAVASVGNIRAVLLAADRDYHFGATRGIVGAGYSRLTAEEKTVCSGDVLALYSDGFDECFGLRETLERTPVDSHQARTVVDRWARTNDDAAVLIYRHQISD